ncbi:LAFE_0G00936g1_1 [Lachancea fermentati]|uniref:peptidylprolyl isomerase n=1 Tax=Lachancea fermentati TaxID=4955 RepID=A0A1G4MGP7_LACFM|nr:LAFE_0G00936g1_1 [Lachancea fermentati]
MQLFKIISLLITSSVVVADKLTELSIGILHEVPESECTIQASKGDIVSVHYTGSLKESGDIFDSSYKRGAPIQFTLGHGQVIAGWDQGIMGMCINEKRKLYIPSEMGYGSRGAGGVIPPDADLIFETELVDIRRRDEL